MEEKVVFELRVIETEDGFRVEVKGDKERLKQEGMENFMPHFGHRFRGPFGGHHRGFFMGRFGGRSHHGHGHHHGWGRWFEEDKPEDRKSKV